MIVQGIWPWNYIPLLHALGRWLTPDAFLRYARGNAIASWEAPVGLANAPLLMEGLGIRALWSLVLLGIALVLCRRRDAICAGRFGAFPWVRPAFLGLCMAGYCGNFTANFLYLTLDGFRLDGWSPKVLLTLGLLPFLFRAMLDVVVEPRHGFWKRLPRMVLEMAAILAAYTLAGWLADLGGII